MEDMNVIHIELGKKLIENKEVFDFAERYFKIERWAFDKEIINEKINRRDKEDDRIWIGVPNQGGFFLCNIDPFYKNDKQQIIIGIEPAISEKTFLRYIKFLSELPYDIKASGASLNAFDGNYSLDEIQIFNIFSKEDIKRYGEERLLNYEDAHLVKKLKNGCIVVWLGKPNRYDIFGSKGVDDLSNFKEYLKKCAAQVKNE